MRDFSLERKEITILPQTLLFPTPEHILLQPLLKTQLVDLATASPETKVVFIEPFGF